MPNVGFRIRTQMNRLTAELIQRAGELPAANLGDVMNRHQCSSAVLRPFGPAGVKLVGPALTVKTRPGDNFMVHKAVDMAQPGDVIVVDAGGELHTAIIGEILVEYAISRGVAGFVVDGAIRDAGSIARLSMPVYAIGTTPAGPYKDGPGEIGFPICCCGVSVSPGDLVVGDEDGIVVVPASAASAVIEAAQAHQEKELRIRQEIATGTWDRTWVDTVLQQKECEFVRD